MRIYYGEAKVKINPEEKVQNVDVYCHIIQDNIRRGASLQGYVYDAYTKKAVKHATIILENMFGNEICMSDSKGHYKIYIEKNKLNIKIYSRHC